MTVILEIVIRTLDHSQTRMTYLTLRTRFHLRLERFTSWTCIRSEVNLSYSETRIDHVVDINLNFFPTFFVKLEFLRMLFCEAFVVPSLLSFLLKLYLVWLSWPTACFVDRLLLKILFFWVLNESIFCFFNKIFVKTTCLKLFWFWDRLVSYKRWLVILLRFNFLCSNFTKYSIFLYSLMSKRRIFSFALGFRNRFKSLKERRMTVIHGSVQPVGIQIGTISLEGFDQCMLKSVS